VRGERRKKKEEERKRRRERDEREGKEMTERTVRDYLSNVPARFVCLTGKQDIFKL
jgi:hypothetical protein